MTADFSSGNNKPKNMVLIAFFALEAAMIILLSAPYIRMTAITAAEYLLGRAINHVKWDARMIAVVMPLLGCLACQIALTGTIALKNAKNDFMQKIFRVVPLRILLCVIVGLVLFKFCAENITNQNFWFDETGQFWMAKGLNHFSKPLSPEGTITDVIVNNSKFNLDPGGFTVLLHFITFLGNTPAILRSLPFVFFLLSFILIVKIAFLWRPGSGVCLLCGFVLFVSDLPLHYAFELRAYSMEMFTVLFALYLVYNKDKIYHKTSFAFFSGLVIAAGITARYSAIVSVMPLLFFIGYDIITKRVDIKKCWTRLAVLAFPVLVMMILVYCLTLRFQNPSMSSPDYVNGLMFRTSGLTSVSGRKLLFLAPLLTMILLFIVFRRKNWFERYNRFVIFAVIQNLFFVTLSLLGKYPWGIDSRWDIGIHVLFILAIIPLLFIFFDKVAKHTFFCLAVFLLVSLLVAYKAAYRGMEFRYEPWDSMYKSILANALDSQDIILINQGASPTIRYLYEYGGLKEKAAGLYPDNFYYFDSGENHIYRLTDDTRIADISNINRYDYVILSHSAFHLVQKMILEGNWEDCTIPFRSSFIYKRIKEAGALPEGTER
jgi:hypothetical protein